MVRIDKDKAFKALDVMASGGSVREAQKATGLSFTQLKELKEVLPLYVEVRELEGKLLKLKEDYEAKLKEYRSLSMKVSRLRREVKKLVEVKSELKEAIKTLEMNRNALEGKLKELEVSSREAVESIRKQLLGILEEELNLIDTMIKETKTVIEYTPEGAYAYLIVLMPPYKLREVVKEIVKEHGSHREVISEVRSVREIVFHALVNPDTKIEDVIKRFEEHHRSLVNLKKLLEEAKAKLSHEGGEGSRV